MNSLFTQFIWNNQRKAIIKSYKKNYCTKISGRPWRTKCTVYCYYLLFNAKYPLVWADKANPAEGRWEWLERRMISNTRIITPAELPNRIIKISCSIAKMLHRRLGINGLILHHVQYMVEHINDYWGKPFK